MLPQEPASPPLPLHQVSPGGAQPPGQPPWKPPSCEQKPLAMSPCRNPDVDCLSRPTEPRTLALLSQPCPFSHQPPRALAQDQTGTRLDRVQPLPALLLPILPHRPFSRTCLLPL